MQVERLYYRTDRGTSSARNQDLVFLISEPETLLVLIKACGPSAVPRRFVMLGLLATSSWSKVLPGAWRHVF